MDVGSFFISDAQSAKLIEPSERPFHDPTPSTQSAAVFGVALREKRDNVAGTETSPDRLGVMTLKTGLVMPIKAQDKAEAEAETKDFGDDESADKDGGRS